jgi:hypothetical protein
MHSRLPLFSLPHPPHRTTRPQNSRCSAPLHDVQASPIRNDKLAKAFLFYRRACHLLHRVKSSQHGCGKLATFVQRPHRPLHKQGRCSTFFRCRHTIAIVTFILKDTCSFSGIIGHRLARWQVSRQTSDDAGTYSIIPVSIKILFALRLHACPALSVQWIATSPAVQLFSCPMWSDIAWD